MVKPRSKQSKNSTVVNDAEIEKLANNLADKPYGKPSLPSELIKDVQDEGMERITITLPASVRLRLEDLALVRKRAGENNKNVSAIIRESLEEFFEKTV